MFFQEGKKDRYFPSRRPARLSSSDIYFRLVFCLENFIPATASRCALEAQDEFFEPATRRNKALRYLARGHVDNDISTRSRNSPDIPAINRTLISLLTSSVLCCSIGRSWGRLYFFTSAPRVSFTPNSPRVSPRTSSPYMY